MTMMARNESDTEKRLPYRRDIQSLRALAIGLVIAAHAKVPGLQGGFIGVDVFFVLSGFLISGLILKEVELNRTFDAVTFYVRRLKRLLPALLVMLLSTALISWLLLSPLRQNSDAQAGQAAALWLSNFYFSSRIVDYFSVGFSGNLYLHTWSLGVEEQFYLIWPWLLLFLFGIWRWQKAAFDYHRLIVGLWLVGLASLALSVYWSINNPEMGFYLVPGRMWEFGLGALIFLWRNKSESSQNPNPLYRALRRIQGKSILNTTGWLLILISTILFKDDLRYPGILALLPCLAAGLVLIDAPERAPNNFISRLVLRQPVLQFLGNVSYSLYLWHWPVLIIATQIFGQSWFIYFGAIAVSLALAKLTFTYVERPIRQIRIINAWRQLLPPALAMTGMFFLMGQWHTEVGTTLQSPAQAHIQAARFDSPSLYNQPDCDTWYHSSAAHRCVFGPKGAAHTVVLFGDSVLAQWFPAFKEIYLNRPNWQLVVLTKSACSASTVHYYYDRIKSPYIVCDEWRKKAIDSIVKLHPDLVVMGSTHYGFTAQEWVEGTRATLSRLSPSTKQVIVMSPTPELGFNGLNCLAAKTHSPSWLPEIYPCTSPLKSETENDVFNWLKKAARPFPNVQILDFRNQICPDKKCHARIGKQIVYRDSQHLTASFVQSLAAVVQRRLISIGALN